MRIARPLVPVRPPRIRDLGERRKSSARRPCAARPRRDRRPSDLDPRLAEVEVCVVVPTSCQPPSGIWGPTGTGRCTLAHISPASSPAGPFGTQRSGVQISPTRPGQRQFSALGPRACQHLVVSQRGLTRCIELEHAPQVWFVVAAGPCPGLGGVDPGGEAHVVAEATVVGRSNVMVMPSCSTTVRARASPVRWVVTDGSSGSRDARTPTPIPGQDGHQRHERHPSAEMA